MKIPTGSPFSIPGGWSSAGWPPTPLLFPRQRKALHEAILREILEERAVSGRNMSNFRGVKRKMSNCNLRPRKRLLARRVEVSKRFRIVK